MYNNDYLFDQNPVVTQPNGFESWLGAATGAVVVLIVLLALICIAVAVLMIVADCKIYAKAGEKWWKALIPGYSTWVLTKITGLAWWWFLIIMGLTALEGDLTITEGHLEAKMLEYMATKETAGTLTQAERDAMTAVDTAKTAYDTAKGQVKEVETQYDKEIDALQASLIAYNDAITEKEFVYSSRVIVNKVLEDKISNDLTIHKLLNDERASAQYNKEKYEPNLAKILYLGTFDLNEKKALLFSKGNIDFSEISALVFEEVLMNMMKPKYGFRSDEQQRLFDAFASMIQMDFNVPIIIHSESKAIIDLYSNFINQYFNGTTTRELDASRFDLNNLYRMHALNNYLYQVFTLENTNNVVIKYHNLHEVKENNLSLFFSLLINSNKYFIQDIKVSIDKRNLINIIFCRDITLLDKRIVEASNVITLDKATEEEKREIIKTKFLLELEKKN